MVKFEWCNFSLSIFVVVCLNPCAVFLIVFQY